MRDNRTIEQRLKDSFVVDAITGCWNWVLVPNKAGYGIIGIKKKQHRAHRFVYEYYVGKIPEGKILLHKCDNKKCVNPEHLVVGTPKQNSEDMVIKQRQFVKISDEIALKIRNDTRPSRIACLDYGIKKSQFNAIRNGTRRAHL